uniref:CF1 delta subunit of ATP synthase n=1 Tax=Climaconeis cf. scalaris TaxID=2846828 RepID=A0A8F8X8D7_9STRA|nr:CF1 delta subunit of ATP synthase [Climaconeis cf. scalaris]QYB19330.1 CF1 delta subunit of ATP synthase [Climaconeis cf. scalaris]
MNDNTKVIGSGEDFVYLIEAATVRCKNPIILKVLDPYVTAYLSATVETVSNIELVLEDLTNIEKLIINSQEFEEYLENPIISLDAKRSFLKKIFQFKVTPITFNFLMVLVDRDRINLLKFVKPIFCEYLSSVAKILSLRVITAVSLTESQKYNLKEKIKASSRSTEVLIAQTLEPNLIGGIVIKTNYKVLDFSIRAKLQNIAKHLNSTLEI